MEKQMLLKEYRQNRNMELYKNANSIIENINSKYCLMFNDDYISDANYLKETSKVANLDDSISVVGTAWNKIDENGKIIDSIKWIKLGI